MDEDDFYGESTHSDYKIEQRSTERLLEEIKISGFRDGHQKLMEDEPQMQLGFDLAYRCLCRVAHLVGKIKAYIIYSSFTKGNTAFLAKVNTKLELIEKYNYGLYLEWENVDRTCDKVVPAAESLVEVLLELENKFVNFEQAFFNLSTRDLEAALDLSDLDLTVDMKNRHEKYVNNDEKLDQLEQAKVQGLNKMIDDISFDF